MILARNSLTVSHVRDIISTTWYYKLQASTASPPAKPTTATPSGWTTTEPSYTEGSTNSLYTTEKTTFSDETFEYSDVSLSSTYEAAKVAYNRAVAALEAVTPIATKIYTGLIGSANDAANASFYFGKIHPANYTVNWKIRMRIYVTAPEAYTQMVDIQLGGYGSTFNSYDAYTIRNTNLGLYFVNLYRATSAGISTNHKGHAIGIGLRSSTNPTNATYARTIKVELLEAVDCTVDMLDTAVKYASIDGTGNTNYNGLTEMDVSAAGQNATHRSENTYDRTLFSQAVKASSATYVGTHIICGTADGYRNIAAGAAFDLTYPLLYYATGATTTIASGSTANNHYLTIPGVNYSVNGTIESGAANKMLYLKGTVSEKTFTIASSPFMTTVVPTEEDGYCYIPLGVMSSGTAGRFTSSSSLYAFINGSFQPVDTAAKELASEKRRVFTSQPEPPYDVGDLWVQGEEGDIMRCKTAKASGDSYDAADWEPASKYTDDSAVNALETVVDDMSTVLTAADRAAADALNATAQIRSDLAVVQETDEGVRSWMTFREEGGVPVLRLGTDSSAVYAVFTNDRLEFRVEGNEDPVAYIAVDENGVGKLYATNSVVVNEMQFGDWAWYQRPNGNMSVKWIGEEE